MPKPLRLLPSASRRWSRASCNSPTPAATDTYDRYVRKTRIVLTYAVRGEVIWVITAWHTSRDPQSKPPRTGV
jgi:hypothetical protein